MARRSTRARRGRRIAHSFSRGADPQEEAYGSKAVAPMPLDMALSSWFDRLRSRFRRESAQTMAEYAVILGVITPAIIVALALLSDRVAQLIDSVRSLL
jgi:Flp pilus assembly pilin Flp